VSLTPLPSDHWSDYFALSTSIADIRGMRHIGADFFYALLDAPEWLIEDGAYIGFDGSNHQLYNVASSSVVGALGLQIRSERRCSSNYQ